jgi:hypothetical protein
MKALQDYNIKELTEKVYDLISVTVIQLQKKTKGADMAVLSKYLTKYIIKDKNFKRLTFNQIEDAFEEGIISKAENIFVDIPTFYKWIRQHKKRIDEAEYKVRTLKENPKQVPYYQEPIKLLK